ncbi:MAG: glutamine amidotransferase [Chloroflexota bacterium]|nr:glutamine amidotransferase [Chloroflexota bacterium]
MTMSLKVLYAADCEMQVTTVHKGMDNYSFSEWLDDSTWLRDVFSKAGDIDCRHLKIYEVFTDFPRTLEEMQEYDVIILSDVGINSLALQPGFRPPHAVPMGPNRIDNLRRYVEGGGGLLMCGGYFSFSGYSGRAGFSGSPVEAVLPVLSERGFDDRAEMVQGYRIALTDAGRAHPITQGLDWDGDYMLLGYNRVRAKPESVVLATGAGDPQIAVAEFGTGRSMAFASDVAPHWAGTFVHWPDYATFWTRAMRWLAGQS